MIIDTHQHVGPLQDWQTQPDQEWRKNDIENRRDFLRQHKMDKFLAFSANSYSTSKGAQSHADVNTFMSQYRDEAGDLVTGFCGTVNPRDGQFALQEVERCFKELNSVGMVFHHRFLGTFLNDPTMYPILDLIQSYNKPVFMHIIADSKVCSAWRLFSLAEKFPKVRFVALDGFSSPEQSFNLLDSGGRYPNVWFDTGVLVSVAHCLREFISKYGSEKVILGTDNYSNRLFFHPFPLYEVKSMGLTDQELDNIFANNLLNLIKG
jgi:predicted TIM-barrel fold metal-dependent hydrolase